MTSDGSMADSAEAVVVRPSMSVSGSSAWACAGRERGTPGTLVRVHFTDGAWGRV